jgi:L-gulonate 3-dehydrogenase
LTAGRIANIHTLIVHKHNGTLILESIQEHPAPPPAAVIGAGTIGRAMALLFAETGHSVALFDADERQREPALAGIEQRLFDLAGFGLLQEDPRTILGRIRWSGAIEDAVRRAEFIQECGPESAQIKRSIFEQVDRYACPSAVVASASSAMPISRFASGLGISARALIAHPANPPFLLRVIELVPSPSTTADAVRKARSTLEGAGLAVILVRKEIEGFVFNRLQGAILREAYCLVRDGVASVDEIDRLVRDGLGLRWSVVGPFETADLNTIGGIIEHARRLGPAYARMGGQRGQDDPWTPELVAEVARQRRQLLPLRDWGARGEWRDRQIMSALAARKANADQEEAS